MRRRRTRNPFVSFCLCLVICSMGWAAWEYREELRPQAEEVPLDAELRDRVEMLVLTEFEVDDCFIDLRGHLSWRPNERRYRMDIVLENGDECEDRAKAICKRIAQSILDETEIVSTVVAFDQAGRELGRCVL